MEKVPTNITDKELDKLVDVKQNDYSALFEYLHEDTEVNQRVDASFHYLKYHDCQDREDDFLSTLSGYIIQYCFPKKRYENIGLSEAQKLFIEGRNKFFYPADSPKRSGASRSGELGEIALYFLLESYLRAPQIISKMSLKTTQGENFKGSDGIHIGINNGKKCVFYCESKLNQKRDEALSQCIKSVVSFQESKKKFEISVINNHIDIDDEDTRNAIIEFLDPSKPKNDDWVEVHACFIGFNWDKFGRIETESDNSTLLAALKKELQQEAVEVKTFLNTSIEFPTIKQRFYFFVMPFKDIENLRQNFLKILYGE